MILASLDARLSRLIRLVGLAFIAWSVVRDDPHPGLDGRGLVVLVLLVVAVVMWLMWLFVTTLDAPLHADTWVLAGAGGALAGASPSSAASAFVFVAVVTAGLRGDLPRTMQVAALGALALAVSVLVYDGGAVGLLAYALGFAASGLAASNVRQYRARSEQAELLVAQTQRSHEEQLRAARLEESARIAREIHDVLAHSLAGLTIQLEATTALIETGADRDEVLARVRRAHELAREGLRETRRAVGALRGRPIAVPDALTTLAAEYRSADERPARLVVDGDPGRLSADAGLAVLRTVQEALTNVTKHAPGAEVSIAVHVGDDATEVVVEDRRDGVPVAVGALAHSGGGFGLQGMRERAAALGGTLEAGPVDGTGGPIDGAGGPVDGAGGPVDGTGGPVDGAGTGWRVELRLPA
jgi:signal transduction histidine kinase